jgi:Ca2+-binding RTX toxin-like protein
MIPRASIPLASARRTSRQPASFFFPFRSIVMTKNQCRKLAVEILEDRCVPAANSVLLQNGILDIVVDPKSAHVTVVSQPAADTVKVVLDGSEYTFTDPVTQLNYQGGKRGDQFSNLTSIAGALNFGKGDDIIYSKAAGEVISAGEGNNFVQDQAGGSAITAGDGDNNIYGGAGDTITVGSGKNIVYDILGTNTINVAAHEGTDYLFTNAASTVNGAQADDRVAVFFAANRQPGSGTLVVENGVLYFTANANGDQFVLNQVGKQLVATYNLNDGAGFHTQIFDRSQVSLIANFGGAGNDTFINNTNIADVQYGAGGNNLLIGGFGPLDLEKAGGAAGNSVAIGRSHVYNDVNGAGSVNATCVLFVNPHAKTNVVRTNNPADQVFGFKDGRDVFISPFQLKGKKAKSECSWWKS